MATVETIDLEKSYDSVCAVDEVNLSIRNGELLVLVGPSGSGKTTLLRLIAGLETPNQGVIRIGDRIVNGIAPSQRRISMVFQSYALYPHMSVHDNIAFPLRTERLPAAEINDKVVHAANMFNIERFLARKPSQLSGGERQRVALARAIVREPDAFLLDEPLSNLDVELRAIARAELKQFQRKLGITTIFVTHDQADAMSMGDRIAVMSEGRIRQIGPAQELYRRPADTFVATFLGTPPMNLIEKDSCIIGFRPENFVPLNSAQNSETPRITFHFRINRVEYLGARQVLYGSIIDIRGKVDVVAILQSGDSTSFETETVQDFVIEQQNLIYFNKHTQLRMEMTPFTHEGITIS
jgi:multiple sugar transport system ATP-binding protein